MPWRLLMNGGVQKLWKYLSSIMTVVNWPNESLSYAEVTDASDGVSKVNVKEFEISLEELG
ncbi:hypothetical protein [Vibrio parahaemolyticus]|uniref:hypothetical protein n=1 Tax=Vibrio parahaemolyticus TaxID=670 RepID=UPI001F4D9ADF|nr:hypothetical protein [Vibrio parahaemolyticus]